MNILKKFLIKLYDENDYKKLDNFIKISADENGYFYFNNIYKFNNDFAYSELLSIDIRSYRTIIFSNCEVKDNLQRTGLYFKEYSDAVRKKKMLLTLILNRYDTFEDVVDSIIRIMNS